jgi:hypothetical protein
MKKVFPDDYPEDHLDIIEDYIESQDTSFMKHLLQKPKSSFKDVSKKWNNKDGNDNTDR